MSTVIDFHAHIIPGADHGCSSTQEALGQLAMMREVGIETVVATPHFYPAQHNVEDFISLVDMGVQAIKENRSENEPKILLGAEILLCPNIHKMPDFEKLCIRGTRIFLLELPTNGLTQEIVETVTEILSLDYTVILAHVDRYLKYYKEQIDELLARGALAQVNAGALKTKNLFRRKALLSYLESGCVVAFGSDLHEQNQKVMNAYAALTKLPNDLFAKISNESEKLLANAEEVI